MGGFSILTDLNSNQQEAVAFWGTPLLVLAGAGSGKTRVLTYRVAWLIKEKGISPENILLQTFTNKAAAEMRERVVDLVGVEPGFAGTFHSFCAKVLRKYGYAINIPPGFVIYDTSDSLDLLKQVIETLGFGKSFKPSSVLGIISSAKNELIGPLQYAELASGEWQKKIALAYIEYQRQLKECAALDFDDLLFTTVNLLKQPGVIDSLRLNIQYVLVDEWQDTNRAQYEIVKSIVGSRGNLTVVGDASQSVYSWRGANYRNISYLKNDFPDITVINLEQNYRSTQVILDAAYGVINKNTSHPILKLWTNNSIGEKIKLYTARSEMDEASFIASEIKNLISKGHSYLDIAILYRINAQSRAMEEAFLHEGIPYVLVGGVRFYDRREVKDVLSYLKILTNPKDLVSIKRAENLGKRRYVKFQEFREKNFDSQNTTIVILDALLSATNYLDLYDKDDEENIGRLENVKELRSVASEFPSLIEFLEQVALAEATQTSKGKLVGEELKGAVSLMTAHSAKGLEFPIVFIIGLEEGLFPHSRSFNSFEELEEERRLAYVGITRAKKLLYLTLASRRLLFGQSSTSLPSRFLNEIPESLLENTHTSYFLNKDFSSFQDDF